MAGDWIKLEKSTLDKPELAILARKLSISHAEAFVSFLRLFIWADSNVSCPGFVPDLSPEDLDTLSRCVPGTTAVLASDAIRWLTINDNGVQFNNWDRHNGSSAKSRAYESERKRNQRSNKSNVPVSAGQNAGQKPDKNRDQRREEKRREEEKKEEEQASLFLENSEGTKAGDKLTFLQGPSAWAEQFWEAYPKKAKRGEVDTALDTAIIEIVQRKSVSDDVAFAEIMRAVKSFAASPMGQSLQQYLPRPALWLLQGCYRDDQATWQTPLGEKPKSREPTKPKVQPLPKQNIADDLHAQFQGDVWK